MDWLVNLLGHWMCLSLGAMVGMFVMALLCASGRSNDHLDKVLKNTDHN